MRASRAAIVVGGSAAILAGGYIAAPAELETLDLGASEPDATPAPGESDAPAAAAGDRFEGPAVSNVKGVYQAQIVVADGELVDVEFLQAGTSAAQSVSVNAFALPELEERFLAAQTWDVEYVSGASFTSPAMVESVRGAFEEAGLA